MNRHSFASTLFTACGVIVMGMGLYFALLRPALLPEDIRYTALSAAQLQAAPGLLTWLDKVFWVLGGYVFTTGLLTAYLAQTAVRERQHGAGYVVGAAGVSSIGVMVLINFMINSDFKWLLLGLALLWATALGLFARRR